MTEKEKREGIGPIFKRAAIYAVLSTMAVIGIVALAEKFKEPEPIEAPQPKQDGLAGWTLIGETNGCILLTKVYNQQQVYWTICSNANSCSVSVP